MMAFILWFFKKVFQKNKIKNTDVKIGPTSTPFVPKWRTLLNTFEQDQTFSSFIIFQKK